MHTDHNLINVREADRLLEPVARVYGTNARWLRVRTADYFGTLDFTGKHMLEVGAGNGLYTCCVSVLGAARPVALEPELKGATDSAVSTFRRSLDRLYIQIVEFYQLSLQEFVSPDQSFDTIYLLASINHLNETHVQTLHCNKESRCLYQHLLQSLFNWLKSGGTLVISDSSRWHAFTPMIKLGLMHKHPFQPNIEWEKHQSPKVWKELLEEIGFTPVHFHWATNWRYRWMPRFLVDNIVAAHFYSSLFVLRAHRP